MTKSKLMVFYSNESFFDYQYKPFMEICHKKSLSASGLIREYIEKFNKTNGPNQTTLGEAIEIKKKKECHWCANKPVALFLSEDKQYYACRFHYSDYKHLYDVCRKLEQ